MITLQPFQRSHMQKLIEWVDSPEFLLQWGGPIFTYPLDEKQIERYIEEPDRYIYSVVDQETETIIGHISLGKIDREMKRVSIQALRPEQRRKNGSGVANHSVRTRTEGEI